MYLPALTAIGQMTPQRNVCLAIAVQLGLILVAKLVLPAETATAFLAIQAIFYLQALEATVLPVQPALGEIHQLKHANLAIAAQQVLLSLVLLAPLEEPITVFPAAMAHSFISQSVSALVLLAIGVTHQIMLVNLATAVLQDLMLVARHVSQEIVKAALAAIQTLSFTQARVDIAYLSVQVAIGVMIHPKRVNHAPITLEVALLVLLVLNMKRRHCLRLLGQPR